MCAGLVPPAVAVHLMGKGGAALVLIMLFMAVTSTGSAEQIAVSSLFAYDVYREYWNRDATGKDVRFSSSSLSVALVHGRYILELRNLLVHGVLKKPCTVYVLATSSLDSVREWSGVCMQIIRVSRYAIVAYGIFMGVLAIILQEIGLNLGWVYLFMVCFTFLPLRLPQL